MPGVKETMDEWKSGNLHSGSKNGPIVHDQAQAIAIALNQSGQSKHDAKSGAHSAGIHKATRGKSL
jgi:hypothetical protein